MTSFNDILNKMVEIMQFTNHKAEDLVEGYYRISPNEYLFLSWNEIEQYLDYRNEKSN